MRILISTLTFLLAFCGYAFAQNSPYIVSPDGQFLGNLNNNRYDPNSVANPFGKYGSPYSNNSINNPYGRYGSPYSSHSATNPYATNSPRVYAPSESTRHLYNNGRGFMGPAR